MFFPAAGALAQFSGFPGEGDPFGRDQGSGPPASIELLARDAVVSPGDQTVLAVVIDHKPGWHSWPAAHVDLGPGFGGLPRTKIVGSAQGVDFGPIQWPDVYHALVPLPDGSGSTEKPTYSGRAIAYIPVVVHQDASGELVIAVTITIQSCDETKCDRIRTHELTATLEVVPLDARTATGEGADDPNPDFAGFDPTVFAAAADWSGSIGGADDDRATFFGIPVPSAQGAAGYVLAALLAALGGLVLNLTPCVLPVIPIKIMSLSQHAGSPGKSLTLGLWMALGVVGFWLALGLVATAATGFADPSRVFGIWWVTLGIGVLIAAMGVGIMGAFDFKLPQAVYKVNPKADTAHGSFLFGVMTAVLGLPCFGFVAGALLAGTAQQPDALKITIFTGIGVGMAAPYLVLAARPSLVKKVPRTGPASELVKQVMGLLMLAAAAYFVGTGALALLKSDPARAAELPWWVKSLHWWAIGVLAVAAGGWLLVRTVRITRKPLHWAAMAVVGLVLAGGGVAAGVDQSAKAYHDFWVPFDQAALDDALAEGRVVVLDFTADWCLNCKALESAVLLAEPVEGLLRSDGVVPMKADLTSASAPGWDKLAELGETGIPLLAVYGPGREGPYWKSNAYTGGGVVRAVEGARGGGGARPESPSGQGEPTP